MAAFENMTMEDARRALAERIADALCETTVEQPFLRALSAQPTPQQALDVALAYYKGDHWRGGAGWVGPRPDITDREAPQVMAEIAAAFVSANKIKEVVNRHRDGTIGHEPSWSLTPARALKDGEQPTADEQARIDEAEAALTEHWDTRGILKTLQKVVVTLLLNGRACLRIFVPSGKLVELEGETLVPPAGDLAQALEFLFISRPKPEDAGIVTDDDTQERAGVYVYDRKGAPEVEISYIDDEGETVLAIVDGAESRGITLDLGGRLWLYELDAEPLYSEQLRELQDQLNMALTMQGRNVIQGGFLERIILNGQMPGEWVADTEAPGGKRFVPSTTQFGASTTNYIVGVAQRDQMNNVTGIASPSVVYRDPVSPDTFISSESALKEHILEEAHQLHALIAGDSTASGESRIQARADFATSLRTTKTAIDGAGRWLLETLLAVAAQFSGQPGRYEGLRATFDCRLDTGPLTAAEITVIIAQYQAGLLDRIGALERLGVDDPDAMVARIVAEKEENMQRQLDLAAAQAKIAGVQPQGQPPRPAPGQQGGANGKEQ